MSRSFDDPEFTERQLADRINTIMSTLSSDGFTMVVTPKYSDQPGADTTRFTTYDPDFRLLRRFLDTASAYDLGVIHRLDPSDKPAWAWNHPANEAFLVRDEPKNESQLAAVQAGRAVVAANRPDVPTLTAVIGEQLDPPDDGAPERWLEKVWQATRADPRLVRFYPIRNDDDLLSQSSSHRDEIPTREFFGLVEQADADPYWYIPQAFGAPGGGYFSLPEPAELTGLVHLALANGARGVLTYDLFPDSDDGTQALWAMEPFGPARNGLYQALAQIAEDTQANAELLLTHERADFSATTNDADVEAVPRIDPRTGDRYVYLINLNTTSSQRVTVTVDPNVHGARVVDVLSGQVHAFTGDTITVTLQPGAGAFIDLSGF